MGLVAAADAAASGEEALVVDSETVDAARERIGADEQLARIFGKLVFMPSHNRPSYAEVYHSKASPQFFSHFVVMR